MSVIRRLYSAEPLTQAGAVVRLDARESHHGAHVLRLKPGDRVAVFDGSGRQFEATIERLEDKRLVVALGNPLAAAPETPKLIRLCLTVAKGPAFDPVLLRAVELGVAEIVPFVSERSVPRGGRAAALERKTERWRQILLSATKQCGRARRTAIAPPCPFDAATESLDPQDRGFCCVPDPAAPRLSDALSSDDLDSAGTVAVMIGPEGGLAPGEIEKANDGGWQLVSLGGRTLRVETAATSALTLILAALGDM